MLKSVRKINPADIPDAARENGFEFTLEELEAVAEEYRKSRAEEPQKLNPDEIDNMAGGMYFTGDDAPDGHEMGCYVIYHSHQWSRDNDTWCSHTYYHKPSR